jgi:hypothetical protein
MNAVLEMCVEDPAYVMILGKGISMKCYLKY